LVFAEYNVAIYVKGGHSVNRQKNVEGMNMAVNMEDLPYSASAAAEIAHEIRNPLTTIKGFLQLIKPYLKEIGKDHYADAALDEINRANDIIYDYLNLAKPIPNQIQETSLTKTVKDLSLVFEGEATLKNIQIVHLLPNRDIPVNIPSNLLKQVLMNLIKNACESFYEEQPSERKIIISIHEKPEFFSIDIVDNGCGMTDETMKKLFNPFYSTKNDGTGIGLCICRKIIEAHGGFLEVNSSPGKGSKFSISIPRDNI
jgi:signal transduction histidine kinase